MPPPPSSYTLKLDTPLAFSTLNAIVLVLLSGPETVKRLVGLVVPMPTLPLSRIVTRSAYCPAGAVRNAMRPVAFTNRFAGDVRLVPRMLPLTSRSASGLVVPIPTSRCSTR